MGESFGRHGTIERFRLFGDDGGVGRLLSLLLAFIVLLFAVAPSPTWGQTTAAERQSSGETPTIGATEQVVLINEENGEEVEALARIDSGAFYTSIGQELADDIGLDTENAETITARSTLGEETRPLVEVTIRIAGQERSIRATVTDRSDVADRMLLGRQDLTGFTIDTSQEQLTTPSTPTREPPLLALLDFPAPPPNPTSLLAALPVAALVAVVFRVLIGVQSFGVFAPVLLALAFVQVGLPAGLLIFGAMLLVGLIVETALAPPQAAARRPARRHPGDRCRRPSGVGPVRAGPVGEQELDRRLPGGGHRAVLGVLGAGGHSPGAHQRFVDHACRPRGGPLAGDEARGVVS